MRRFEAIPAHPQKQYTRRWRLYLFCGFYYPIREVIPIAIYHWNIGIVSRGKGKSAVAAAAYRSGEKLTNEWDGMTHDYTRKGGVVHTEIMLPLHAPPSFSDRSTLWNSVELYEKAGNAQLAREIDAALPIELSREEQIRLVREYCSSQFVSRGMCVDFVIHDTDNGNPHCHIMLTMRPLDELDASLSSVSDKAYSIREGMKTAEQRMKELQKLMEHGRNYQTYKPIQDEYRQIRWKGKQEKFAEARRAELTLWNAASRYLHANLPKGTKTLPIAEWEQEYADLKTQRDSDYAKLKDTRADVAELQKIRRCVDIVLRADQPEQMQSRTKRHEQER